MQTNRLANVKTVCRYEHEMQVTTTTSGIWAGVVDREGGGVGMDFGGFRPLSYSAR
jgi:hypothetical protein